MAQNVTWNGVSYSVPDPNDTGWGPQLTAYLVALPAGALQKSGGTFTLTSDVDFGVSFGLKSLYFKSRSANIAATGVVRLANAESVVWRNAANSADLALTVSGGNVLQFNGISILLAGLSSIINADISASAAIAFSKMAALTASRALQSDGSGVVSVSAVTATELGYVSGVTSAIQTQLNAKATDSLAVHLAGNETITGTKTFSANVIVEMANLSALPFLRFTKTGIVTWRLETGSGADLVLENDAAGNFYFSHSGSVLYPDGTSLLPSVSFSGNTAMGMYRATNTIGWSVPSSGGFDWRINNVQVLQFTAANFLPVGAGTISTGDASNYWNDISYKTLTDRGCLPWCDEGVEMPNGAILSDLDALCAIKKHPIELTIQGLPKLDYSTFPKRAYRPADKDGKLLPRDENNLPIGGADGVEMTMVFGVMIGAFKQVKAELDALRKENEELKAKIK